MILVGNWKMNLSVKDSISLANEYVRLFKKTKAEIVACPSFTSLPFVCKALEKSNLAVGAQDVFWETKGAFTGEVSASDLVELGVSYVIIGHSERRNYLGEEDWMINNKIRASLATRNLSPILCIGETKEDHDNNEREEVLSRQLSEALDGIKLGLNQNLLVAYEPIWSIGTGELPTAEEISYVTDVIRVMLRRFFGDHSDRACAVLYGGSIDENTVKPLMKTGIDGFLVGGASIKAKDFYRLAEKIL